jgi:hypothetical protein
MPIIYRIFISRESLISCLFLLQLVSLLSKNSSDFSLNAFSLLAWKFCLLLVPVCCSGFQIYFYVTQSNFYFWDFCLIPFSGVSQIFVKLFFHILSWWKLWIYSFGIKSRYSWFLSFPVLSQCWFSASFCQVAKVENWLGVCEPSVFLVWWGVLCRQDQYSVLARFLVCSCDKLQLSSMVVHYRFTKVVRCVFAFHRLQLSFSIAALDLASLTLSQQSWETQGCALLTVPQKTQLCSMHSLWEIGSLPHLSLRHHVRILSHTHQGGVNCVHCVWHSFFRGDAFCPWSSLD